MEQAATAYTLGDGEAVVGGWAGVGSPATESHPATSRQQVPPGETSVSAVHSTNVL